VRAAGRIGSSKSALRQAEPDVFGAAPARIRLDLARSGRLLASAAADHRPVGMRLVVDNSTGGDEQLAASVADGLRARDYAVEVREPEAASMFDTSVHLVSTGIVLRVEEPPAGPALGEISQVVCAALSSHPSQRRRTRAVPVAIGSGGKVLTWIDVFD
jgi:hypothetical protein